VVSTPLHRGTLRALLVSEFARQDSTHEVRFEVAQLEGANQMCAGLPIRPTLPRVLGCPDATTTPRGLTCCSQSRGVRRTRASDSQFGRTEGPSQMCRYGGRWSPMRDLCHKYIFYLYLYLYLYLRRR
jgi:hypothetical protein